MNKFFKIDDSDLGNKIRFLLFMKDKKPGWKNGIVNYCKKKGKPVPDINLSDFDFFVQFSPKPLCDEYVILDDDNDMIGHGQIHINNERIANIDISIDDDFQGMGLGTELIKFIENDVFKRDDIKATSILDMSDYGQSGKIAKKLGYELKKVRYYEKKNPNYKEVRSVSNNFNR